jgi:hypothetical protein
MEPESAGQIKKGIMGAVLSIIGKIFKGIIAAVKWIYADNARLREAKAGRLGIWSETANADKAQSSEPECIDVWDEIDHLRRDMWFGGWIGGRRYRTRPAKRLEGEMAKESGEEGSGGEVQGT